MDVGNDPFPREEITGLAAFENLEPVGSLSVLPPESEPPPEPEPEPGSAASVGVAGPRSSNHGPDPFGARAARGDATMPLDLSAEHQVHDLEDLEDRERGEDDTGRTETHHGGPSADDLFDTSTDSPGWDDPDEATRVATPSMVANPSTALEMDWDDDEPPTRMRADGMLDMPSLGLPMDWDEASSATQVYDSSVTSAFMPSGGTLSGGRPSPFPPAPQPSAAVGARSQSLGAPSPFGATVTSTPTEAWLDALKSGDRRAWTWAGSGALGLIVLALFMRAISGGASTGTVTLTTTPIDAHVLIDGRATAGTSSPYTLSDLSAGKHDVLIQKSGFVDYRASFVLTRGEQKTLPPVELVTSVHDVGFAIRSAPGGAEVWVDGRATDQLTPAKLTGMVAGIHRLQLKHPGFADYDLQMFVPEGTLLQLTADLVATDAAPAAQPAPVREARFATHAASSSDVGSSEPHVAHKTSSAAPTTASPFASAHPVKPAPVIDAPSTARVVGGHGATLRINTRPWAQVFVDGRLVGNTPQPNLQLSPGNHKIHLVNQPMGFSKNFSLSVKAGEVVTKVINLAE